MSADDVTRYAVEVREVFDSRWAGVKSIGLGRVPPTQGTPDFYVLIEESARPCLRVDFYANGGELRCFQDLIIWNSWVILGHGESVYFVSPHDAQTRTCKLGDYFGSLYPQNGFLLVASGSSLIRFDDKGDAVWHKTDLGLDGVLVHDIDDGVIHGSGEWDPPGGWRLFRVDLETGSRLDDEGD